MNRTYIGIGIIVIVIVTIILSIVLIPSASHSHSQSSASDEILSAPTTFPPLATSPYPLVPGPNCKEDDTVLNLTEVRIDFKELHSALTTSCAGIHSLELNAVEIIGLTGTTTALVPKLTLNNLTEFYFDRTLFPEVYTRSARKREYLQTLTPAQFQDDLVFLTTKSEQTWTLDRLSAALELDLIVIKVQGEQILKVDRTLGTVEFKRVPKSLEKNILTSVTTGDKNFVLRQLTGQLSKIDVDQLLLQAESLTSLQLYYSGLYSTSDPTLTLHSVIPFLSNLTQLHLHLFDAPFTTLDIADLVRLSKLTKLSFQYGGSTMTEVRLTYNSSSVTPVTLPTLTYLYVSTDWGQMDRQLVDGIPKVFPNLQEITFDSYNSLIHDQILNQLLKMPSLLSITFYSYNLIPQHSQPFGDVGDKMAETSKAFLRHAGVTSGLHDFVLTRSSSKDRWQGREVRFYEKEGYKRMSED